MKKVLVLWLLAGIVVGVILVSTGCSGPMKPLPPANPQQFTITNNSAFPLDVKIKAQECQPTCRESNYYYTINGSTSIESKCEYDRLFEAITNSSYYKDISYCGAIYKGVPMYYPTCVTFSIQHANTNCFPIKLDYIRVEGPFCKEEGSEWK